MPASTRHRVVVVGGGFAGLAAARELRGAPVRVTLVDRSNHHLFQPLLYQVATAILSPGQIAPAIRDVLRRQPNADVLLGEVDGIDVDARTVSVAGADGAAHELAYDSLILAAGSRDSYFGHDEWAEHALPMKTIDHAVEIRSRLLHAFEAAAATTDPELRRAWLTFVVVGAGPTGVELAGQIATLADRTLRGSFRGLDTTQARIVLAEGLGEVLTAFGDPLPARAQRELERMGIEVRLGAMASSIDGRGVELRVGDERTERIDARTVLWTAGVEASPLARVLGEAAGAEVDRRGRVAVGPDCSLPGRPEVFAVGDLAALGDVPGLAPPAMQEGRHAARVIRARLAGEPSPGPFRYVDKGTMAVVGRWSAVADVFGRRISGPLAFALWGVVHIAYLIGWGSRAEVLARWQLALASERRRERLILARRVPAEDRDPSRLSPASRSPPAGPTPAPSTSSSGSTGGGGPQARGSAQW